MPTELIREFLEFRELKMIARQHSRKFRSRWGVESVWRGGVPELAGKFLSVIEGNASKLSPEPITVSFRRRRPLVLLELLHHSR